MRDNRLSAGEKELMMIDHKKRILTYDDPLYNEIFKDCMGNLGDKMKVAVSEGLSTFDARMFTDEMMAYYIAYKRGLLILDEAQP